MAVMGDGPLNNVRIHEPILMEKKRRKEEEEEKRGRESSSLQ